MGWMTDWNKLDGGLALPSFAGEASELGDFSSLMNSFAAASQLGGLGASMPNNFNNFQQQQQYPQAALNIAANAINGCSAFTPNTAAGHSLNNVSSRTLTPKCVVEAEPNVRFLE
jgi:hypothetical protein